ncbi:MAG TPA: hypothetical protein VKR38_15180 [Usitatibacter sp.]|nr:hypothetical protein [Usitatibacter sp.]
MTPRRALAGLALAAVVATRVDPAYVEMLIGDRDARAKDFVPIVDVHLPQYARFLAEVRSRTAAGDSIAIVTPDAAPRELYPLAYYRASYLLPGREVLPVIDPQGGAPIPGNRAAARYVAVFGDSAGAGEAVWKGEGGALYRR